ncbi:MAG: cyclic nucleotide-binding domain-containing protein [Polyangiaceae bacterium]
MYVVESGRIEIQNPTDGHGVIVVHDPGQFSGDIDLLTGRPVIVTAVARGQTRLLCVPGSHWFGVNHHTKRRRNVLFVTPPRAPRHPRRAIAPRTRTWPHLAPLLRLALS